MVTTFDVRNTFDHDGNVVILQDDKAVNQCIKVLLKTTIHELFSDPDFGSQLRLLRYSNMTPILKDILEDHMKQIISTYDRRVTVRDIDITYDFVKSICYIDISYEYQGTISELNLYISTVEE